MGKYDLLAVDNFRRLWKDKDKNEKFCALLACFQIDLENTERIEDDKYVILYDRKEKEYIVFFSSSHPLEEDFLERKERLHIEKQRLIGLQ